MNNPLNLIVVHNIATVVAPCRERSTSGIRLSGGPPSPSSDWVLLPSAIRHVCDPRLGKITRLSISISGGKGTNQDSLSNGERSGNSSGVESPVVVEGGRRIVAWRGSLWHASTVPKVDLELCIGESDSPVGHASGECRHLRLPSWSRVVWDCSPKWVVDFI